MSGDWIGYVVTAIGTLGSVALGLLAWRVSHRTQRATERNQQHEQDDAAFARMKSLFEIVDGKWQQADARLVQLETERSELRKAREEDQQELSEMHHAIDTLRSKVARLEGKLMVAIDYLQRMLAWAAEVSHPHPYPPIPDDIADLIITRDKP